MTAAKIAKLGDRNYVGIRAQRLVAPVAALTADASKQDKALPIWSEADFRATKTLIVGTDFIVDKPKVKPAPSDLPFRWLVAVDDRERPAISIVAVLRQVHEALDPGYATRRVRIGAFPLVR